MKRILLTSLLIGAGMVVVSCDQLYFSTPQPVNAQNSYEFPVEARGSWTDGGDSLDVGITSFISIEYHDNKVSRAEMDASKRYKFKGDKVYVLDDDKGLSGKRGFPYVQKNDTVYYKEAEIFELCLGSDTFLRKADDVYILNSKHGDSWYEIFLIDLTKPETAVIRYLKAEDLDKVTNLKTLHVAQNQYFLEARWTPKQITELRQKGVFSDTLVILKRKKN